MKLFRIVLSVFAFALAMGAAVASNELTVGFSAFQTITNVGVTLNGSTFYSTVEVNVCDLDLTSGPQCTVMVNSALTKPAYHKTSNKIALYRP